MKSLFLTACCAISAAISKVSAVTILLSGSPFAPIPDNSPIGVAAVTQVVTTQMNVITSVEVSLVIENGFNGDFFAYLTHGAGYAVLLNRPGRTSSNEFGYADSGFNVSFTSVSVPDIHSYQDISVPPANGPLTGMWAADGRAVDPLIALDSSPRTALLSSFVSLDPNGEWALFIADRNSGGVGTLKSWSITIVGIPEPSGLVFLSMSCAFAAPRRRVLSLN